MKNTLTALLCLMVIYTGISQENTFEHGDLIFQQLHSGAVSDAISECIYTKDNIALNHIGIIIKEPDGFYVVEAISPTVHIIKLQDFINRAPGENYYGRVTKKYKKLIHEAVEFAKSKVGISYDDLFLFDNNKYYSAELVHEAFKFANKESAFFTLYAMNFKSKDTKEIFPVWQEYYDNLNHPIPQLLPGTNAGFISLSNKITFIGAIQ